MKRTLWRIGLRTFFFWAWVAGLPAQESPLSTVRIGALIQFWNEFSDNRWDETFHYVRLKLKDQVDEQTNVFIMPVMGSNGSWTLLDAYAKRDLGDQWLVTAGQFKTVFGDDRMLYPDQLKRVDYARMDKFCFPGNPWDMGFRLEKILGPFSLRADLIQGAGPNVLGDNNSSKDVSGRVEWKEGDWALGASYYGGTSNATGFTTYQNWWGAHARYASGGFDIRMEAIWAPVNNAYTAQLAYQSGDFEPLVYGEMGFIGTTRGYQLAGIGINFRVASETRLSFDETLNGVTDLSGSALGVFQVEQIF